MGTGRPNRKNSAGGAREQRHRNLPPAGGPLEPPSVGRVWAAALLDATLGAFLWAVGAQTVLIAGRMPGNPLALPRALLPGLLAFAVLLHLAYHVFCVGRFGRTLGKSIMNIAVVRRNGSPAGYRRALLRSIGGMATVLTLGLANLGVLLRRDRRGMGDFLADTRVVRVASF